MNRTSYKLFGVYAGAFEHDIRAGLWFLLDSIYDSQARVVISTRNGALDEDKSIDYMHLRSQVGEGGHGPPLF